jgi:hypothetical protein
MVFVLGMLYYTMFAVIMQVGLNSPFSPDSGRKGGRRDMRAILGFQFQLPSPSHQVYRAGPGHVPIFLGHADIDRPFTGTQAGQR